MQLPWLRPSRRLGLPGLRAHRGEFFRGQVVEHLDHLLHALHARLDSAADWLDAAPDTLDHLPADDLADPAVRLQRRQDIAAVIASVERLPDNYRRMMTMIYEDDMTLDAVGAELGVSAARVWQMHRKAVERVAQACSVRMGER